jgi:hypothetical protein
MLPEIPPQLEWLEPWQRLEGPGDAFVNELQKEVSPQHALHGVPVVAIARRMDCDDVLFATADRTMPLAVVHLTWSSRTEVDPQWPSTALYKSWGDWTERCLLADHEEYSGDG